MTDPQTKEDLIAQLGQQQHHISALLKTMSPDQLRRIGGAGTWSAADYTKHLILSVKPVAKALTMPPDQILGMTGVPDHPSRTFAEFKAVYQAKLDAGVRAEDNPRVVPVGYRMPEGVTDEHTYLIETWNDANTRLIDAVRTWDDAALDTHQLPHPAIGMITIREMLFFTLYHNTLHGRDIENAGR